MLRDLVIIGAGGFAPEGLSVAEDCNAARVKEGKEPEWIIHGCAVFDPSQFPPTIYSYPILGTPKDAAAKLAGREISFVCMIGDNRIREEQAREAGSLGWKAVSLIHPTALIARETRIGAGTYVAAGSVIGPYAHIGEHVIINTHVSVGHDAVMQDFSHACPGARISGHSVVGRSALIGSNGAVMPGCRVGEGAVVGANSLALEDVDKFTTVIGTPAKMVFRGDL